MDTVKSAESLKFNWLIWKFSGINPPKGFQFVYFLYILCFNIIMIFFFSFSILIELFIFDDLKQFLLNLIIFVTVLSCNLKYLFIFAKIKTLNSVKESFDELDNFVMNFKQRRHLKGVITKCHKLFKLFAAEFFLTWLTSGASMIYYITKRHLLYPAWFPFDWKNSNVLTIAVFLYQFSATGCSIFVNIASDTFPPILLSTLQGHYQCLGMALDAIDVPTAQNLEENYRKLITCVKYHQSIERNFKIIANQIASPLFIQLFATGFTICLTAILVVLFEASTTDWAYNGCFCFNIILEILLPCYFGDELMCDSDLLTTQLYSCNWLNQSKRFKGVLLIFMQNSQKKKIVLAGNLVPLSLPTFVSIMKMSYSLFAVLKEMK